MSKETNTLAGIEYSGRPGISRDCQHAVMRLLQYGDKVTRARILSSSHDHCLLLTVNGDDLVAIKSGFTSGYRGEGPYTFSYIIQLLDAHGAEIEEYEVAPEVIERLDNSSLTSSDIDNINLAHPIRPNQWYDYVFAKHEDMQHNCALWEEFPCLIPLAMIDRRIVDLAISFRDDPDKKLLTGYRRLEDIVRKRTGIDESGAKLFSQAYTGPKAKLGWKDIDESEQVGRAQLFTGVFMAHRNPRAHRETEGSIRDQMAEFLLLNHLYCLEKISIKRRSKAGS